MAEPTQAEVVNDTQQPAMPTGQDQKTPDTEKVKENNQLPEEASDRTKGEFEKLKNELREERQARERVESAYATLTQPKKEEPKETPIYDSETGLINPDELTKLQKEAKQAQFDAQKAREEITNYKQQGEYARAYQKYEWTNPDSKGFDEKKSNLAAAIALASMVDPKRYGADKPMDLEKAAEFVEGLTSKQVEEVKAEAAQKAIEQLSPKEQAALEATGNSGRREPETTIDYEGARTATRKGGNEGLVATMARLRALKTNKAT